MPTLTRLGEFDLIARLARHWPSCTDRVTVGIGDDCAVFRSEHPRLTLTTTDMFVEDIHFTRTSIQPRQLGAKIVAGSVSDIAAMGGQAQYLLIAMALPSCLEVSFVDELYVGIKEMGDECDVTLVGGDTTSSSRGVVINATVIGSAAPDEIVYRSGAQPNDRILVSGSLGDSAAGLDAISNRRADVSTAARAVARSHLEPAPALFLGRRVAQTGLAHAMIDVSDGLLADLGHICQSSHVGCRVDGAAIPLSSSLVAYASEVGCSPLSFALTGGEDYRLLIAGAPSLGPTLAEEGIDLTEIGRVTSNPGQTLINVDPSLDWSQPGWDHFRRP